MRHWLLAPLLLFLGGFAHAQGQHTAGEYQVYYSALPSAFLTPEIAQASGVLRSRARGVLVVSVQQRGQPVQARITAQIGPGGGPLQPLELRLLDTNGAPSYIGSFAIAAGESRRFHLRITPPAGEPFEFSFSQQFFE